MILITWLVLLLATFVAAFEQSTQGIQDLVKRRLPNHVDDFAFRLTGNQSVPAVSSTNVVNDRYTISSTQSGKILVEGNSPIALASGQVFDLYCSKTTHVLTISKTTSIFDGCSPC